MNDLPITTRRSFLSRGLGVVGVGRLGRIFQALTGFERWARRITGALFILIGLYLVATRIAGLNL